MTTERVTTVPHPITGQPIGPLIDPALAAGPAKPHGPVTIEGRYGRIEKITVAHAPALWEAVEGHDAIWTYMSRYGPFADFAEFSTWVAERHSLEDPYSYAIVDLEGRAVGIFALMEIRAAMRSIEVGHVVYSPRLQKTPLATEAQYLLARYVFETLGYRRYEWKCESNNAGSKRAALRFGFTYEGVLRQQMIAKGRNRDTAMFSMLDSEWPDRKARFERWLAPNNFDSAGRQKTRLGE